MSIRLVVKQRGEAGPADRSTELLLSDPTITLGRDTSCQVVLSEQAVSRKHAKITSDGPLFFIEDLGSAYGTEVGGQPLPKGEKRLLANGDLIAIAQFDIIFDRVADLPKESSMGDRTSTLARQVIRDAMKGLTRNSEPFFRVMNGPNEGRRIEINDAREIVFGRDDKADVVLQNDLVSRLHAKVRRDWEGTHVEDLKSRNGVRVNRQRITRKSLKDRDELEIGGIRFLYLDPSEIREAAMVLPAEEEGESTAAVEKPAAHDVEPSTGDDEGGLEVPEAEPEAADEAEEADSESAEENPEEEPEESDPGGQEPEEEPAVVEQTKQSLVLPIAIAVIALIALALLIAVLVA